MDWVYYRMVNYIIKTYRSVGAPLNKYTSYQDQDLLAASNLRSHGFGMLHNVLVSVQRFKIVSLSDI